MRDPIIHFENFSFKYRAQIEPTLKDINLDIYPGEKVLVVGPSGSGKSTLAHCLNGLVPFAYPGDITGKLTIDGKKPADLGIFGMSKLVGTVLQDTDGQFIGLTVAEDIAFALENDCVEQGAMHARVDQVAETVEVRDLLDHAPSELSGGQKQRVSMAGVMIDEVPIMLFDEPLANLDPATGKRAIELIDRITKEHQVTALIIEHRIEDALYRDVDRVIVVGDGRIVADMHPDKLLCTDILKEQGIREPLYITALKHAGAILRPEDHPQHIETMNLEPYKQQLKDWFERTEPVKDRPQKASLLEVNDLTFAYVSEEDARGRKTSGAGRRNILQNISFRIREGEMISIVGKNGAGKTTLSNLICGFLLPGEGDILIGGENMLRYSVKERGERIGLVMQNPNQMISKAMIFDEVALGLKVRGVPEEEIRERVNKTLKICGLYPFRNWPVSALSFGQKKRVTIASILVMDPDILILDEPTAGQDYHHYTEIMEFLKMVNETAGITIMMITHDMHLMLEYTDRALVIADGQLLADQAPARVLTDKKLTEAAYLKETSLYELALRCGIEMPEQLAERFIYFERGLRSEQSRREEA